jgi:hypothetical protein
MSVTINSTSSVQSNTESAVAVKTAKLAKNQQALEGEMALKLIQSANIESLPTPTSTVGTQINIKV